MSHIWSSQCWDQTPGIFHTYNSSRSLKELNESCHTYEWVMSHIWMNHVRHTNESCHTYEVVMSHIWSSQCWDQTPGISYITPREAWGSWTSHARDMDVSCHTCKWVMSHERMRSDMMHSYVRHDSFIRETWLIRTRDMTHSYVRHDSFLRETCLMMSFARVSQQMDQTGMTHKHICVCLSYDS